MFEGKVALVTGAGSGIGRATALLFGSNKASVVCADIDAQSCDETAAMIREAGGEAATFVADLSEHDACGEMVDFTVKTFGRLDHAFNNAGVRGQVDDIWNEQKIKRVLAINLEGVFWAMKHEIAHMQEHGGGTIVNTSSTAGTSGAVGAMDYTAAKYGVIGLTKSAQIRFGKHGIRINAVCPGLIETPMTVKGRAGPSGSSETPGLSDTIKRLSPVLGDVMGKASDIADAVIWLSSPQSAFVYGVALGVDGGFSVYRPA
jgi:NAD(P)-dependent dehydrogenase (short-subunit alcohol dehydrogenase family)